MKKSKICPKCQSQEVYTDRKLSKSGDRCSIPITSWKGIYLDVYLCLECGYVEEHISESSLNDEKLKNKIKETWQKLDK